MYFGTVTHEWFTNISRWELTTVLGKCRPSGLQSIGKRISLHAQINADSEFTNIYFFSKAFFMYKRLRISDPII